MKQALTYWLQILKFLYTETKAFAPSRYRSLNVDDDYAEVWWAPRATYWGADKSIARISYSDQDLQHYTKAYGLMILLYVYCKHWYIVVSTGRCS